MANTYTSLLWEVTSSGGGIDAGPGPAAGFRWIVTDVEAFNPTAFFSDKLDGFQLLDDSGYAIANNSPLTARGHKEYHWSGRQVIDHPATLQLGSIELGWLVRVTGFELTLP